MVLLVADGVHAEQFAGLPAALTRQVLKWTKWIAYKLRNGSSIL
jgi:hypothetical protein